MEYKQVEPLTRTATVNIGGWVQKPNKSWSYVSSHVYKIESLPLNITVDDFIVSYLGAQVSATGRSDAQGRGPGMVLGEEQSKTLDNEQGCRSMLRLFNHASGTVHSSSKVKPYTEFNLCPRGDNRRLFDVFSGLDVVTWFLDSESPDSAVKKKRACCIVG